VLREDLFVDIKVEGASADTKIFLPVVKLETELLEDEHESEQVSDCGTDSQKLSLAEVDDTGSDQKEESVSVLGS
jgi:hypothetical protein